MKKIIKGIKNTYTRYKENKEFSERLKQLIEQGDQKNLYLMWMEADPQIQKANRKLFSEIIKKLDYDYVGELIHKTDKSIVEKSLKKLINQENNFEKVYTIWKKVGPDIRKENSEIFSLIIDKFAQSQSFCNIWEITEKEIKDNYSYIFPIILNNTKDEFAKVSLIQGIDYDTFMNNSTLIRDIIRKVDHRNFGNIWYGLEENIQSENIDLLIDKLMTIDNNDNIEKIWLSTRLPIEKKLEVFNSLDDIRKTYVWGACRESFQEENSFLLAELLEDLEDPSLLANIFIGTQNKISELSKMKIPDDLKQILLENFDEKNKILGEHYLDYRPLIDSMTVIMENWYGIKEYMQRKKANSIINDGIEVRKNSFREIVNAGKVLNSPIPNNASAQEFELIKGSERIGIDTKFTSSNAKTRQRGYELAKKMDEQTAVKKYPNFSLKNEDENIYAHVLHPQEKSAILFGYDTDCCFRPNGTADNSAKNEYSLLQYCLTTPYGGVLRCEDTQDGTIYMGTPFLVNGNCLMLHSYETANGGKKEEVNDLLVEIAKKAIKDSNGSIDIVFMTDLHVEEDSRLNIGDKIILPKYFQAYTENEYKVYEDMYNNLESDNVVLAARVENEILTGDKLLTWFNEKCNGNPDKLIECLNLHMGERKQEWDFGRRQIKEKLEVPEIKLVQAFLKRKKDLEKTREDIAFRLYEATDEEKDKLRMELRKNREEELRIYSGEDIDLIAEIYNINIEQELAKKAEESVKNKKTKDRKKQKEGNAIGILISDIRKINNENINSIDDLFTKIRNRTINANELEILEHEGVDISLYKKMLIKEDDAFIENIDSQQNIEAEIVQKVKKGMKSTEQKEKIVSEILFREITEEEIKAKAKMVLNVSIGDELRRKTAELRKGKQIEDLNEQEKTEVNEEVQRMNLKSLISAVVENKITEKHQQFLDELINGEYKLDLDSHTSKIKDKEKMKREIRSGKLAKLKALVTYGINTQQKISVIKSKIDGTRTSATNIASLVYGNSWYIALDENKQIIETRINPEIDEKGLEKEYYEETLAQFEEREKKELQLFSVKTVVQDISINDKQKAKRLVENTKNDENVIKM